VLCALSIILAGCSYEERVAASLLALGLPSATGILMGFGEGGNISIGGGYRADRRTDGSEWSGGTLAVGGTFEDWVEFEVALLAPDSGRSVEATRVSFGGSGPVRPVPGPIYALGFYFENTDPTGSHVGVSLGGGLANASEGLALSVILTVDGWLGTDEDGEFAAGAGISAEVMARISF
jgi:hypothetical protein